MKLKRRARVTRVDWYETPDAEPFPAIQIYAGGNFVVVHLDLARAVVDQVHDICDAHDSKIRKEQDNDH